MTTLTSTTLVPRALARTGCMVAGIAAMLIVPAPAAAQALGPFSWQLQPYCNVITLRAFPEGQAFRLEGTDDNCGTGLPVRIVGTATADGGGNVSLAIVTPGPNSLATVTLGQLLPAVLRGPWTDSQGRTGTLVFGVIGPMFGSSRPAPQVSGAEIVDGTIAAADVDLNQIQVRVTGACPSGEFIQGVGQNGTVTCASAPAGGGGDITAVAAGAGLIGGGLIGDVALSVDAAQFQKRLTGTCAPGLFMVTAGSDGTPACTDGAAPGSGTTALGANALSGNTAGQNSAFGENALASNTVGGANSAFGANALLGNTTGVENTAVGQDALRFNNGSGNSALGQAALFANTTGSNNTAIGQAAMGGNTTGSDNTAVGDDALRDNSSGSANSALGQAALLANSSGASNTAVGAAAMGGNLTGSANTAVGAGALRDNGTGVQNTAVGQDALRYTTASGNSALGQAALFANTTGADNTALGQAAMGANLTGTSNTAVGDDALRNNTAGSSNTAVGAFALTNSSGSTNIAIGMSAGSSLATGSNNIYIGHAGPPSGTESGTIRLGTAGTHSAAFVAGIAGATSSNGVAVFVDLAGQLGTATSSRRFKSEIEPIENPQAVVQALRPVTFVYRPPFDDGTRTKQYGLIAEEVAEVSPALVVRDETGQPQTVRYHFLAPLLIAEVQRLERERRALTDEVESLRATVEALAGASRAR